MIFALLLFAAIPEYAEGEREAYCRLLYARKNDPIGLEHCINPDKFPSPSAVFKDTLRLFPSLPTLQGTSNPSQFKALLGIIVIGFAFYLVYKFQKRWGTYDNFENSIEGMGELADAIDIVGEAQADAVLRREVDGNWKGDAKTRRRFYQQSRGPIIIEVILGTFILMKPPHVVYKVLKTYMSQARKRWEAMVKKEYS